MDDSWPAKVRAFLDLLRENFRIFIDIICFYGILNVPVWSKHLRRNADPLIVHVLKYRSQ